MSADPFAAYRVDLEKVERGVWHTHPATGDRFLVARMGNVAHTRFLEAKRAEKEARGEAHTDDQWNAVVREALATTILLGWELVSDADYEYTPERAISMVHDPEQMDLVAWIRMRSLEAASYRKAAQQALGN